MTSDADDAVNEENLNASDTDTSLPEDDLDEDFLAESASEKTASDDSEGLSQIDNLDNLSDLDDLAEFGGSNDLEEFDELEDVALDDEYAPGPDEEQEESLNQSADDLKNESSAAPFIKSKQGKISIGAGVVVLCMLGGGYVYMSSAGSNNEAPRGPQNYVSQDEVALSQATAGDADSGFGKPIKHEITEPVNPNSDVTSDAGVNKSEEAVSATAVSATAVSATAVKTGPGFDLLGSIPELETKATSIRYDAPEPKYITKGDLNDALLKISKLTSANNNGEHVFDSIEAIERSLASVLDVTRKLAEDVNQTEIGVKGLLEAHKKKEAGEVDISIVSGRERLKGYKVINSTDDKSIVVASTPSGEIKIFFSGADISVVGEELSVTSIGDNGKIVLVGEEYYFDTVYEKLDHAKITTSKVVDRLVSVDSSGVSVKGEALSNWTLNAVFDEGFLLKMPSGDFLTVGIGQRIPQIGIVDGLNREGNLVVSGQIIQKASF